MQFKLSKTHRYWWPARVRIPSAEDAGTFIEQELRLQLEPLPRDEALKDQDAAGARTGLRDIVLQEEAQFLRVIKNWEGVVDDAGDVVPFSPEKLRLALQHSWFRNAVAIALKESIHGDEARLGN